MRVACWKALLFAAVAPALLSSAQAAAITLNPSDDADVYASGIVQADFYVSPSNGINSIIKFDRSTVVGTITSATLSLNPYSRPLYGPTLQVYGFTSDTGSVLSSEYDAGTFLGTWSVPASLDFGEDIFFDVTSFLASATSSSSYVGFNLRGFGDCFSSLEHNYGHPSQLAIIWTPASTAAVPEPASCSLLLGGLGLLGLVVSRQRWTRSATS